MIESRTAILLALTSGENYGLGINLLLKAATNGRVQLSQGRLYPVLDKLEREGLLVSHEGPPVEIRMGRPRRYYQLTATGRRAAQRDASDLRSLLIARQ